MSQTRDERRKITGRYILVMIFFVIVGEWAWSQIQPGSLQIDEIPFISGESTFDDAQLPASIFEDQGLGLEPIIIEDATWGLTAIGDRPFRPEGIGESTSTIYVSEGAFGYHTLGSDGQLFDSIETDSLMDDIDGLNGVDGLITGQAVTVASLRPENKVQILQDGQMRVGFGQWLENDENGLFTPFNPHTVTTLEDQIYIIDTNEGENAFSTARLYQFDQGGTLHRTVEIEPRLYVSSQIDVDENGSVYIPIGSLREIWKIDSDDQISRFGVGRKGTPIAVAVGDDGQIFVLLESFNAAILEFDLERTPISVNLYDLKSIENATDFVIVNNQAVISSKDGVFAFELE